MTPITKERAEAALAALMGYRQADEDGVMVLVSRQAIHEVSDALAAAEKRIEELEAALRPFDEHYHHRVAWSPEWREHDVVAAYCTIGDLRRAHAALQTEGER